MRILIYCGHPAQYHFFKNIIKNLKEKNHTIKLLIRTKDVLENLLKNDKIDYENILPEGRISSKSGIFMGLVKRDVRLNRLVKRFRPDLMIGSDPSLAHIGRIKGIPILTVVEDDHYVIPKLAKLTYPFTTQIIAPSACDCGLWNSKKISYNGFMKLAYLHPSYFLKTAHNPLKKKFLIRLTKLDAHHDFGINGFTKEIVLELINKLKVIGDVSILGEGSLDPNFKKYELKINPNNVHEYLSEVDLLISDSQSKILF